MIIGVAGHRILTELHPLEMAADSVYERLAGLDPNNGWQVLSSLAEGADRLLVECLWQRCPSTRLTAVLPLPAAAYRVDFTSPVEVVRFDQLLGRAGQVLTLAPVPTRTAAYLAAGLWLVERCDVLVVIWDGQLSQGEGSTAEVVAQARRLGRPLAIIRAGNRLPGTRTPTSLGAQQGMVLYEKFEVLEAQFETNCG